MQSQNIEAPDLSFTYACAKDGYNMFNAIISFNEKPFNTNNTFFVELSDAQGSFDSPHVLKAITDQNYSFDFETSFQLPTTVKGDDYRIRVRSTSPAMVSPVSASFNAYFIPDVQLILNNYQDVSICGGKEATISLNHDIADAYLWYKNGVYYGKGSASLTVTEPGEYYAEPYFGDCTGTLYSNIVIVNFGEAFDASITGDNVVEACPSSIHTFSASNVNAAYTYKWYKDGVHLSNLPAYTPYLRLNVTNESYGDYKLVVVNEGGCEATSQPVTLQLPENGFTVNATTNLQTVLLNQEAITLQINTNAPNPTVVWYKNNVEVSRGEATSLHVTSEGTYHAEVSAGGSCGGTVSSPEFNVFSPQDFMVTIVPDSSYTDCESSSAEIKVTSLTAKANGIVAEIPENKWNNFVFDWTKNDVPLSINRSSISVSSYHDNGKYCAMVSYGGSNYVSNKQDIALSIPTPTLTTTKEILCNGNQATLTTVTVENAVYDWYKDNVLYTSTTTNSLDVSEHGEYAVAIQLNGCTATSNTIKINPLDDSVVTIHPSKTIYITPDSQETITASGANRYVWTDPNGLTVSTTNSFTASEEGTFTVTAYVDGCTITKTITVIISETLVVPNIISPNQDNVNDTWVLPAKYVNDPNVEVTICDSYGKPVFKTTNYQNNWPQSSSNAVAKSAIYYYFINKNGKALKKGSITVVGL
jgi:gliding motility-associated-like protein